MNNLTRICGLAVSYVPPRPGRQILVPDDYKVLRIRKPASITGDFNARLAKLEHSKANVRGRNGTENCKTFFSIPKSVALPRGQTYDSPPSVDGVFSVA